MIHIKEKCNWSHFTLVRFPSIKSTHIHTYVYIYNIHWGWFKKWCFHPSTLFLFEHHPSIINNVIVSCAINSDIFVPSINLLPTLYTIDKLYCLIYLRLLLTRSVYNIFGNIIHIVSYYFMVEKYVGVWETLTLAVNHEKRSFR